MPETKPTPLLSTAQVLNNLPEGARSVSSVYGWIGSGKLPSVKIGKRRFIRRRDLAEFLGLTEDELVC
jgi:excisionase family DNA binding protein